MNAVKVLVSDTSVLIDLERGSLLVPCFHLSFALAVPDLLYERELKDYGGNHLLELGLRVEALENDGVALSQSYQRNNQSLSMPDSFALALAKTNSQTLLSGDRGLRELAEKEKVECHGVLWLLNQLFKERVSSKSDLHSALEAIASHPRCRLPKNEIQKRLLFFSAPDQT